MSPVLPLLRAVRCMIWSATTLKPRKWALHYRVAKLIRTLWCSPTERQFFRYLKIFSLGVALTAGIFLVFDSVSRSHNMFYSVLLSFSLNDYGRWDRSPINYFAGRFTGDSELHVYMSLRCFPRSLTQRTVPALSASCLLGQGFLRRAEEHYRCPMTVSPDAVPIVKVLLKPYSMYL